MRHLTTLVLCILVGMALLSCSRQEVANNRQILFSVEDFISEESTKTNCDPSNNYAITWASGDVIGIFPREGYQEPFTIPAEQVGKSSALFDGGYWDVKEGLTYNAYYPFDVKNFQSADSKEIIPVIYTGQSQTDTQCNVGAYDYTYSDWTVATGGNVSFQFHHIGAFLVLSLPIPANTTYTKLTLTADGEVIPTAGTYDLTADKPAFVPTAKASSLSMDLINFSGIGGETFVFYMMLPPCDLSSSKLNITLTSAANTICIYTIESKIITAGKLYKITGRAKSSDVSGTVDSWAEETDSVNGHAYVDLGLASGTLWATMNVGADKVEDYGDYFAWGETTGYCSGKTCYFWSNYKYSKGTKRTITKYCTISTYGVVDNKTELELSDDAAHANWGGNWRMPSKDEWVELSKSCTWVWISQNGVEGYEVTSKTNGNSIFIPYSGWRDGMCFYEVGCSYWSSSLSTDSPDQAFLCSFGPNDIGADNRNERPFGRTVRPVFSERW